jgi:phytoene dehydrogenase-like protein
MADQTFDAVIIGGGSKALYMAMYLTRYAGMSVGIYEARHEIGGGLCTEETAAPGFRGNPHAVMQLPWYHAPTWRDFPEFWDCGVQFDQHLCSEGAVFHKDETCLAIYSDKHDTTQERTATEIAKFSEKDAEKWLKLRKMWTGDAMQRVQMDMFFLPAEERLTDPGVMTRSAEVYPELVESGFNIDSLILAASPLRVAREFWDSPEMQYCALRFNLSSAIDINQAGHGVVMIGSSANLPNLSFIKGGTHQVAHAAHQILVREGCKFFTHCNVEKVIIENGTATGIRLVDGSEIAARKLVVSTLSPHQLVFDLIGEEHFNDIEARRVKLLEDKFGCLMWYTFAIKEAPKYKGAGFNPDIDDCFWLGLAEAADPMHISRECMYSRMGQWPPPIEDYGPVVWCHSKVDPSFAPEGYHTASTEQYGPPASAFTEKEWMDVRQKYAEDLISIWEKHAPNMNWDNIVGCDYNSPFDALRTMNRHPNGNMNVIDHDPHQFWENRPTPELANHRTPVKNLYATGAGWSMPTSGTSEAYNCYKIIAKDMNLGKPWEEPGKEEPDSLVEQVHLCLKRIQDSASEEPS